MCQFFNGCEDTAVWSWRVQIRFLWMWGRMKSEVYKEKVNTRDELVARIANTAALIKRERQDDVTTATRTVAKRAEKCTEVGGGIFEHLLWTVAIYWDHLHNKCNQYVICLSFIPFVRLFMHNVQTAVTPHPMKIVHTFIRTSLLGMVQTTTS